LRDPSRHSCNNPKIRITKNKVALIRSEKGAPLENIIGSGVSKAISISNTKKITASRKNRRENGIRAEFLGSKPHSKGDSFSRNELWR